MPVTAMILLVGAACVRLTSCLTGAARAMVAAALAAEVRAVVTGNLLKTKVVNAATDG
jgi:hypothetical protein